MLCSFAIAAACSGDGGGSITEQDDDAGTATVRADAQANAGPDAAQPLSTMRLAHLAAETGPIDFCYQAAHAGTFVGPVLGGPGLPEPDASDDGGDAGDAGDDASADGAPAPPGAIDAGDDASDLDASNADLDAADADAGLVIGPTLGFGTVTKYLVLQASGSITVAVVPAGATSCSNPIAQGDVTLDPGKLSTVALFSRPADGGTVLDLGSFTDDRTTAADSARVRVIHAALGTSTVPAAGVLAVRANAAKVTVLADHVEPHKVATASDVVSVDNLGYVTAAPAEPPTTIAIGPAQTDAGFVPWVSQPADLALTGGSLHTAFILNGDAADTFALLWCTDLTTDGDHTTCSWVR